VEVVPHIGNPYTTVTVVVDPSTMWSQLIVEHVEVDAAIVIVVVIIISIPIFFGITIVVVSLRICAPGGIARR